MARGDRRRFVQKKAEELQKCLPRSELWFWDYYKKFKHERDLINVRYGQYIPDVINHQYKYIIEIDGSIHNSLKAQQHDLKKTLEYQKFGYKVFRITAYREDNLIKTVQSIIAMRCRFHGASIVKYIKPD